VSKIRLILVLAIAICLQTVLLHYLPFLFPVDLFLVLIICAGLVMRPVSLLFWALAVGLVHDTITGGLFGSGAFARIILAYLLIWLRSRFIIKGTLVLFTIAFVGTFLDIALIFMVRGLFDVSMETFSAGLLVYRAFCNGLVAPLVMKSFGTIHEDDEDSFSSRTVAV